MDPLSGNVATLGCCKKLMHMECLIKCMQMKLTCPMCRAEHESLKIVQQDNLFVNVLPRNQNFFRDAFFYTTVTAILIVSISFS